LIIDGFQLWRETWVNDVVVLARFPNVDAIFQHLLKF
jgi:hypothetical protein